MKLSILFLFVSYFSFSQDPDTLQFHFETDEHDSFTISKEDNQRLKGLYKETRILGIQAHCDHRGSEAYNLNLSKQRMEFIRSHLIDSGFDVSNSKNEALGESQANSSGLSLDKCRRVDVLFIEPAIEEEEEEEVVEEIEIPTPQPPVEISTPQPPTGISKNAVEKFLEDDDAEELEFDLTILFVNVSTRVLEESKPEMFQLLEIMQNNPSLKATFHGHVCCQPHQELSEGRARAVAIFLREYGITADRLAYMGHSNNQPKVWPEVTDEDRKQNRRVAVVFTKTDE